MAEEKGAFIDELEVRLETGPSAPAEALKGGFQFA
jgi:hypothetical protein